MKKKITLKEFKSLIKEEANKLKRIDALKEKKKSLREELSMMREGRESMDRDELMVALKQKYPRAWFKLGEDFSSEEEGSIWSGEGSYTNDDIPLFNYYDEYGMYEFGVLNELNEFLESVGWYAETYDPGTYFFYKD